MSINQILEEEETMNEDSQSLKIRKPTNYLDKENLKAVFSSGNGK